MIPGIHSGVRLQQDAPALAGPKKEELDKVASDFESLLIGQLMQGFRSSLQEGSFGESESGGDTMIDFASEHLSKAIAERGGLGLAKMVSAGLRQNPAVGKGQFQAR